MTVNQADEHAPALPNLSADPRDIITPEAFRVLPALYGLPLAGPWRRLSAITIDALLVVVLAQSGGLLLAVAAAVLFFSWVDSRGSGGIGRGLRSLVGVSGSVMLFIAVVAIVQPLLNRWDDDEDVPAQATGTLQGTDAVAAGLGLARLHGCDDARCREAELERLAEALASSEMPAEQRRDLLLELASGAAEDPEEHARLKQHIEAALPPAAAAVQSEAPATPADDEVSARDQRIVGEDGSFSALRTLKSLADDLGFSFGWGAVYFTLLTVLWDGQTLGKRWLGIRVIALSGKSLSYWEAFNRYGGYAAGFATGLLGFLQVFWDPNRQAIHDQISFTAVIRDVRGEALGQLRAARAAAASESQPQA